MFSQCKIRVNLSQKALPEYIKVLAHHIKEALIGASDEFAVELVFDENEINTI